MSWGGWVTSAAIPKEQDLEPLKRDSGTWKTSSWFLVSESLSWSIHAVSAALLRNGLFAALQPGAKGSREAQGAGRGATSGNP